MFLINILMGFQSGPIPTGWYSNPKFSESGCKVFSLDFQVNQIGQVTEDKEEQEPDSGEEETQV